MIVAKQLCPPFNCVPCLIPISSPLSTKSFTCHTSENSLVSPSIATLPKARVSNPCPCHTCETPRGSLTSQPAPHPLLYVLSPCIFNHLQTLLRNGDLATLCLSITSALFSSPRRVYESVW